MNNSSLAFDIDGCITDTMGLLLPTLKEKYGVNIPYESATKFKLEELDWVDLHWTEILDTFYECMTERSECLMPQDGALEFIEKYSHDGNKLLFITAREDRLHKATYEWFERNVPNLKYEIKFVGVDDSKYEHIIDNNIRTFVEDRADTALKLAEKGINIILLDYPWNREEEYEHPNITRVNSWYDINEIYENLLYKECG